MLLTVPSRGKSGFAAREAAEELATALDDLALVLGVLAEAIVTATRPELRNRGTAVVAGTGDAEARHQAAWFTAWGSFPRASS